MRKNLLRSTALSAAAVSLALLVTACGSEDKAADKPADAGKGGGATSSAPEAPAAKGKTDAEVKALLVTQAELPKHLVKEPSADEAKGDPTAASDKAECKPLVQAQTFTAFGTPTGTGKVKIGSISSKSTGTAVTVASYDGKGAEEAFTAFKTAAGACAGGYTATQDGTPAKVSSVAPDAVTAGDEAAGTNITIDAEGMKLVNNVVVVRKGHTLVTFSSVALTGQTQQPKEVIEAQVKKLG
ncbi:hypothetical protein ACN20G_09190 [Streptomyces sp. BI20]|uniref:hypothetical protein n=1 Tax=Streptomyces sp. BI20 TaxID=3403460 RepID=UPI003C74CED5